MRKKKYLLVQVLSCSFKKYYNWYLSKKKNTRGIEIIIILVHVYFVSIIFASFYPESIS